MAWEDEVDVRRYLKGPNIPAIHVKPQAGNWWSHSDPAPCACSVWPVELVQRSLTRNKTLLIASPARCMVVHSQGRGWKDCRSKSSLGYITEV